MGEITVPLQIRENRVYLEISLNNTEEGAKRTFPFTVDTGGGGFIITETLARELGLQWGSVQKEQGMEFARPSTVPRAFLGDMKLELDPDRVLIVLGENNPLNKSSQGFAAGLFPGHLLASYNVVFDYLQETFSLRVTEETAESREWLPMPVSEVQGFPRTEIVVDGEKYGMLLDTGASFSIVDESLLQKWAGSNPEWPKYSGAYGEAKTLGGVALETMFVPDGKWGDYSLGSFGVVSQPDGTFKEYMSSMMKEPVVGALGGNVLKNFRLELDYPNERLYLSR